MTPRRTLWGLIAVTALIRLAWAASLGPGMDEAYHYLFVVHRDWSYFDHPPMLAVVEAAGVALSGGAISTFALRLGFIALFAGSTWLLARLTSRQFGDRAGVMAALTLNLTVFYGMIAGTFSSPDGPLLFFWLLTLDRLAVALRGPDRTADWAGVGLAWGGAILCKYYAVLLPAGAVLYLVVRPSALRCLRTPGPYLAALLGVLVFSPTVYWNATHGWASFAYQGGRAGGFQGLRADYFFEALLAQVLYLTPWVAVGLAAVVVGLIRRGLRGWTDFEAFLVCQAAPALGLFLGVATFKRIMPHWPMIGFVALLPMLGRAWADRFAQEPTRQRRRLAFAVAAPVAVALLVTLQAQFGLFQDTRGRLFGLVPPQDDPTVDALRWTQIARELKARGLLDAPNMYLFTDYWRNSAELSMAARRDESVACLARDARSYTFWSRPEDYVGRDAVFVQVAESLAVPAHYEPWFRGMEPLGSFPIVRRGVTLQTVNLYRFRRQTDPFPFGYNGVGTIPLPGTRHELTEGGFWKVVATRPPGRVVR